MARTQPSKASRAIVGAVLGVTGAGPVLADLVVPRTAGQHLRNPNWPPHAKFHDAQYIAMSGLISAIGLRVLLRRAGDPRAQFYLAAALGSVTWLGMWATPLFPGTAATDPEFEGTDPPVLGLHPQMFLALVMLVGLGGAVTVERRRGRAPAPR